MHPQFIFDSYVTGKDFVGREQDVRRLMNMIVSGESIALFGEPGTGKMSLIQQTLTEARLKGMNFQTAFIDFAKCRTTEDIVLTFADGILKSFCNSSSEIRSAVSKYLSDTHFVFDEQEYRTDGKAVATNWIIDEIDVSKTFSLPSVMAADRGVNKLVILIDEFQSISFAEEDYQLLKQLENVVSSMDRSCVFIMTGSHMNAMRDIFSVQRWFWRSVERFEMSDIPASDMVEYINRKFQLQGKVIEKDIMMTSVQKLRCNVKYVMELFFLIDSISRGYVTKADMDDGMKLLLGLHEPRFYSIICSLTDFQLSLLRAIMSGEVKFSSSSVIDKYKLNSSANVKRLKDALVKKEVVWFDEKDEPHVQDPLFEYWLAVKYFA